MSIVESNTRIIELLAQGIDPKRVVNIVGCKVAYMNELLQNEDVKEAIAEKAGEYLVEANEEKLVTNKYLSLENTLLRRIEEEAGTADMAQAVKALQVVAQRQDKHYDRERTTTPTGTGNVVNNVQIVSLHLPKHAIPEYQTNKENEVIAVGDKILAPMSSKTVEKLFIESAAQKAELTG